jgi:hypothetical protein
MIFLKHTHNLFVWLISHQSAVLFSQNKPVTSNQPTVLFSHNKSAPATSHTHTYIYICAAIMNITGAVGHRFSEKRHIVAKCNARVFSS